jgi:hypothetical protein
MMLATFFSNLIQKKRRETEEDWDVFN